MNIDALKIIDNNINWGCCSNNVIIRAIIETPIIVNYLDAEDWRKFSGWNWSSLLSKQPQLGEHCDWDKLDGDDWSGLLRDQPQFSEHCDWDKLSGWEWEYLLKVQPQFEIYRNGEV